MKKLNKLEINPERIMMNEELIILRGGYTTDPCSGVYCDDDDDCCISNPDCEWQDIIDHGICCSP